MILPGSVPPSPVVAGAHRDENTTDCGSWLSPTILPAGSRQPQSARGDGQRDAFNRDPLKVRLFALSGAGSVCTCPYRICLASEPQGPNHVLELRQADIR